MGYIPCYSGSKGVSPSPLTIPFPSLGWNEWTPFLGAPLFHMKFQTCSKCMVRCGKQSWQSKVLKYSSVCRSYHLQMILGMNMEMLSLFDDHKLSLDFTVAIQLSNHPQWTLPNLLSTQNIASFNCPSQLSSFTMFHNHLTGTRPEFSIITRWK